MLTGIEKVEAHPPRVARELKQRLGDLLNRYAFDEVLQELANGKPKLDIHVSPTGQKRTCPRCGAEQP